MTHASLIASAVASTIAISFSASSCVAEETKPLPETLIRLSVAPAAEPRPALKYRLLPEFKEMSPGNPIQGYLKCILEQFRFVFDDREFERRKALLAMPFDKFTAPDERQFSRAALEHADRAARLDTPDWQVLLKLKENGIAILLPDVQGMRALARALQARFRSEVSSGRIDDGLRTAKTMFALARHMGEHPTLIGDLVAAAMASVAIEPLQAMLELPDCPNLYWALTNLPDPFISIRNGLDGERLMVEMLFRDLDSTSPMPAEQIKRSIDALDMLIGQNLVNKENSGLRAYLAARTSKAQELADARNRLIANGLLEERVKTFPADQVILLDEARECQARFDAIAKNMVFPAWQLEKVLEKSRATVQKPSFFADLLLSSLPSLRRAQGRIEQRFGLLRHVEALRMYAAAHNALPLKLSDVTVPLPVDAFTGEPFGFESNGMTAHIRGTPPADLKDSPALRLHYEITLRN